jgi:uncharacterized membrane protein
MNTVIVDTSFGNVSVYPGTLENAEKLLSYHLDGLDPGVMDLVNNPVPVLNKDSIENILNKILSGEEGQSASKTITVTKEIKQELVMYCFNNKIEIKNNKIDAYALFKIFKVEDLSFFANNENYPKDAKLVDDYVLEQVRKYKVIKNNSWKEGAKEVAKIRYILEFAKELAHRDVDYEVTEMREPN